VTISESIALRHWLFSQAISFHETWGSRTWNAHARPPENGISWLAKHHMSTHRAAICCYDHENCRTEQRSHSFTLIPKYEWTWTCSRKFYLHFLRKRTCPFNPQLLSARRVSSLRFSVVFSVLRLSHYFHALLNSVPWVGERTILIERPPLVGEVSASFFGKRVPRDHRDGSLWPYSRLSRPESLLFLPSSSSVLLT
jgi:hypothetical protein